MLNEKFSIVTTCKGRLHHLKRTLPLFVAAEPDEIIVVDYGCPDHSGEWVNQNYPSVKVVHITDDQFFNLSRARNEGAKLAASDWIVFIDADILLDKNLLIWLRQNVQKGAFYNAEPSSFIDKRDLSGTVVCRKADYQSAGGYDENFKMWGGEDGDFYFRLNSIGLLNLYYSSAYLNPIAHGDEERTVWHPVKDKAKAHIIGSIYLQAKSSLLKMSRMRGDLDQKTRNMIIERIYEAFDGWEPGQDTLPAEISFSIRQTFGLPANYAMEVGHSVIIKTIVP